MSAERAPLTLVEPAGLSPEQNQTAKELMRDVRDTQADLNATGGIRGEHDNDRDALAVQVPVLAITGLSKAFSRFNAGAAKRAATKHYRKNAGAYQEQALIDAKEAGKTINGFGSSKPSEVIPEQTHDDELKAA